MFRNGLIIFAADYLIAIAVFLAVLFWRRQTEALRKEILWRAFISFPVIFAVSRIMGALYYNPRPFAALNIVPFVAHSADNGFPSDHTLLAAAAATLVFTVNKKWGSALFLLAVIVGIGRVAALVHHPVDILGSLIAASAVMTAVYYAEKLYRRRFQGRSLQTPDKIV